MRRARVVWRVLACGLPSGPALAYRPFDGTDAAVAPPGELETRDVEEVRAGLTFSFEVW